MNEEKKSPLLGVGVGVAGVVSAREGIVHYCPNIPGWENTPLAETLESELSCDVIVDDSVRCRALAEKRYGVGRRFADFLYLYFGRGVGAGMLIGDRIFRGANGLAGEFGHMTVDGDGPLCRCGNKGCLEAVVSEEAIIRSTREMIESNVYCSMRSALERGDELSLEMIRREAQAGDKLAGMIINNAGEAIGTGIANLVNVLDPGVVVCGGEIITQFGESVIGLVERTVKLRAIRSIAQRTEIYGSLVPQSAAARGAATLMIERFLANEVLGL
jgi:glucokinase